jgi:hypothetical protein
LGFVWDDDRVASRPGYVSTDVPAGALICGAFEAIWVGLWGAGFTFSVDPFTSFRTGVLSARVLVDMDVVVLHPAAFNVATSVT